MNTPDRKLIGTTISERIRTCLTRPGLVVAAAAIGFGLAGSAAADPAFAAPTSPHGSAQPRIAQVDEQARKGDQTGKDDKAKRDDGAREGDKGDKDSRGDKGREDRRERPKWVSPMPTAETTSCFGPRWGTRHKGVDLAAKENTPVNAAGAGTVLAAGWLYQGYGISVVIDHGDGHLTHYAHLNGTTVTGGDRVEPGDRIGFEGDTGDSTGPHLHFEVHKGAMWKQVDPGPWMKARGVDLGC